MLLARTGRAADVLPPSVRQTLDGNPITRAMADRDFCLHSDCLRAYAETAGAIGGAAAASGACTAAGLAVAAPLCAAIGAWLGRRLAGTVANLLSRLGRASGQTLEEQELRSLRDWLVSGGAERANERLFALLAYAVEREAAVRTLSDTTALGPDAISALMSEGGVPTFDEAWRFLGGDGHVEPFDERGLDIDAAGFVTEPARSDRRWAEWKIASALDDRGVTRGELASVWATVHPPPPLVHPEAIPLAREWQATLRTSLASFREQAAERGFIDLGPQARGQTLRLHPEALSWYAPEHESGSVLPVLALGAGALALVMLL